jgi:hypothetical protein
LLPSYSFANDPATAVPRVFYDAIGLNCTLAEDRPLARRYEDKADVCSQPCSILDVLPAKRVVLEVGSTRFNR